MTLGLALHQVGPFWLDDGLVHPGCSRRALALRLVAAAGLPLQHRGLRVHVPDGPCTVKRRDEGPQARRTDKPLTWPWPGWWQLFSEGPGLTVELDCDEVKDTAMHHCR